jgi:alkanesulfonate monooxygenase SsuD/methylene tetrahydromethanopterin reductase-like flavin-dependent oxidoreductase (luciferase family)
VAGFRRADRARRTDAFLRQLPALLSGETVQVPDLPGTPDVRLLPQAPPPPVWIGGASPAALRRAVTFGSGWLSGLQTPGEFAASAAQLADLTAAAGRPSLRLGVVLHASVGAGRGLADLTAGLIQRASGLPPDRARELAVGATPDQVARQVAPCVAAGAEVIAGVCDPVPSHQSAELVAEVGRLLRQS